MLEHFSNQASGLLGLCSRPGRRLISVVHHGDEQAELPMLWQLCLALVSMGYTVTVLDATIDESTANPGLQQLLDRLSTHHNGAQDAPSWSVLPSKKGLNTVCAATGTSDERLARLCRLFPADGLVIVYCGVDALVSLMGQSDHEPLLAVSPVRSSLLTSYIALKRLLIAGNLKPTIINMQQSQEPLTSALTSPAAAGLHECAKKFLGFDATTFDISDQRSDEQSGGDMQRLALRVLERSTLLNSGYEHLGREVHLDRAAHFGQFARSH